MRVYKCKQSFFNAVQRDFGCELNSYSIISLY